MSEWQPIETAPLGEYALFHQAAWRHPWVGRYTGVDRIVVLDNCDTEATQIEYHADLWMPLPPLPLQDGDER
jgi:hypothetical protein